MGVGGEPLAMNVVSGRRARHLVCRGSLLMMTAVACLMTACSAASADEPLSPEGYVTTGSGTALSAPHDADSTATRRVVRGAPPASGAESAQDTEKVAYAEQFRRDLRGFAADLEATGRVSRDRARMLAYVAVSEGYRQGIPPALILGVMHIENDAFRSTAVSSAGAIGLMQVMPRIWIPALGHLYGTDLRNDATNIRMGVHVLATNAERTRGDWRTTLLRYNGCVRGTNTPDCHRYPDKVRRAVERYAPNLCPSGSFETCAAVPLWHAWQPES